MVVVLELKKKQMIVLPSVFITAINTVANYSNLNIQSGQYSLKHANLKSCGIRRVEAAFNNLVIRVHLQKMDLDCQRLNKQHHDNNNHNNNNNSGVLNGEITNYRANNIDSLKERQSRRFNILRKPSTKSTTTTIAKKQKYQKQHNFVLKFSSSSTALSNSTLELNNPKLCYDFQKLLTNLFVMSLPSPLWKVRVSVRKEKPIAIVLCNNSDNDRKYEGKVQVNKNSSFPVLERSVTFFAQKSHCKIVVGGVQVVLVGAPRSLDTLRDIEVLCNVVNAVPLDDCMLEKL